ncbi:MAG: hypothetical protein ABSB35_04750 [Bryobacteraceae bacterium]
MAAYLLESTIAEQVGDACVITLPIPTVDGRVVGVFIEPRVGDYFLVNDGGKAVNELTLQGVKITDSVKDYMAALARNFDVVYADEMFQSAGKQADLQRIVLAIGACSSLAMAQLVGQITSAVDEPAKEQFGRALKSWARKRLKVSRDVSLKGKRAQHRFDFVASPKIGKKMPIVMSVLSPGSNPLGSAQRFGFHATDLDSTPFAKWPRVAVEDRAEIWSAEAKNIVRSCADVVIEIPSGAKIDARLIGERLRELVA